MVRVFAMKVTEQDFEEDKWKLYLSESRRKAALRKKKILDRQLFLGAEVLLNKALEQVCKSVKFPAAYERNAHGKPYLLPSNQKVYVNWSHSGEYVLCAVADREVGADLQWNQKEPRDNLIRRTLSKEERVFYEAQASDRRSALFYEYWTLKEAYLKMLGTGFRTPLEYFRVEMTAEGPKVLAGPEKIEGFRECSCCLLDFADERYTAALCCEGGEALEGIKIEYLS